MTTDTIRCPNCKTVLQLPQGVALAREIAKQGGDYMGFGQADSLPCSACGHRISMDEIVKPPATRPLWKRFVEGLGATLGCLGILAVGLYALLLLGKCS